MQEEDTISPPAVHALFYLPALPLAFTALRLLLVYYVRLGRAGWILFCPAPAVKGKVESGCKLLTGRSWHCLQWKSILSLFSHTQCNRCLCVCLVLFLFSFLFLWHIAYVAVAMWGSNMELCLTQTAYSDIRNWRKWGFYWQVRLLFQTNKCCSWWPDKHS